MVLIIGIDDAGRGPLIGPMILAGVLITKTQEDLFKRNKITDSKLVKHPVRIKMSKLIKENSIKYKVVKAYPEEIDNSIKSGVNLNTLEAIKSAEIINFLNNKKDKIKVIVDCPSVNKMVWAGTLINYIEHPENLSISCEHKADLNHVSVSAASILAKVAREEEVEEIKKKYGDFGSGYPSDDKAIKFLKENGVKLRNSGIFRKSWATWKSLFSEKNQSSLKDF